MHYNLSLLKCIQSKYMDISVVRLDGSVPVKYGLRLNSDSRYYDVKQHLHVLTSIPPHQIMLSDVSNAQIKVRENMFSFVLFLMMYSSFIPKNTSWTVHTLIELWFELK